MIPTDENRILYVLGLCLEAEVVSSQIMQKISKINFTRLKSGLKFFSAGIITEMGQGHKV